MRLTLSHPLAAAALLSALLPTAQAVEGGATILPAGVYDFGAGQLPPPSELGAVGLRVASYQARRLQDDAGQRSPVGLDLSVQSLGLALIRTTGLRLGDAQFGWGMVVPTLKMAVDLSVPTPVGPMALSGRHSAQGDLQLIPAMLQWVPSPGVYANAQFLVQLPTGAYDKKRLINPGSNHWSVSPSVAVTWIQPSGFELSSHIQLNIHGRNKDTDYRSGTEYQHEFALGQHIGAWTVGLGGYYLQQISDDRAPGLTKGNRIRVLALGPAVNFFDLGSGMPSVWVHAYKEFYARNRSQGTNMALRLAWLL